MKEKLILVLLVFCAGFTGCCPDDKLPSTDPTRTILVYMMANNSLDGYAADNISDMIEGATSENLNNGNLVVYYAGRGAQADSLFLIKDNVKTHIKNYDERNSTDPGVMRRVIQDVVSLYPAGSYGLVLWSHGTAWFPDDVGSMLRSFGQNGNDWMEIDELAAGLPDKLFDFILFDACYMASVECVYELRNKADYILASPTETLAYGWPYSLVMGQLFATDFQPEKACETFYNYYLNSRYPYATVSLTKTSELENLKNAVRNVLAGKTEKEIYSLDPYQMQRLEYLYYSSPGMLYDLADYIKLLATDGQYAEFRKCMEKAVPYKAHTEKSYYGNIREAYSVDSYSGLTVFVPKQRLSELFDWYKTRVSWYRAVYQ